MNSTLIFHHDTLYRHQLCIYKIGICLLNKNIRLQYNVMYYNFVQNLVITIKYIKHHVVKLK